MSNLAVTGAVPIGMVDHLQYGNPENPEVYWTFKEAIRAIRDYLLAVKVPCVGGKVSFYNEDGDTGRPIKPTPVIATVGLRQRNGPKISEAFTKNDNDIILVGNTFSELGGSEYYESIHNLTGGHVPKVNLKTEKRLLSIIARVVNSNLAISAHDVSKGGLAVALAVMAVKGMKGVTINLDTVPAKTDRVDYLLFSESRSRFIIETQPQNTKRILYMLKRAGFTARKIGTVNGDKILFISKTESIVSLPLTHAYEAWNQTFPHIMEAAS
jgi:phosphoribosylformylglycinamidine synthase